MEKIRLFGILHIIGNIIRKEIKMDVINEYEQVLIGNLPKIPPRLFQNEPSAKYHRKMKGYGTSVKTAYKYRLIVFICRIHTSPFIPRA